MHLRRLAACGLEVVGKGRPPLFIEGRLLHVVVGVVQKEVMATREDMDHAIQEGAVERRSVDAKAVRTRLVRVARVWGCVGRREVC